MNKIKIVLSFILLFSSLLHAGEGTPIAPAVFENGDRLDYQACRVLVKRGEILPMSDLMELANKRSSDHILDAYLVKENDQYYYQIESVGNNGVVSVFYMDATNGEIVQNFKVAQ